MFVDNFWLYEGYEPEHKTERILPTGTLELVINLRQNELLFYDDERPEICSRLRMMDERKPPPATAGIVTRWFNSGESEAQMSQPPPC
jgi:hypothetical protein